MDKKLDLADAQFVGFYHGKHYDIISLIVAMGLTKKEWGQLKKSYVVTIDGNDLQEVENYFQELEE